MPAVIGQQARGRIVRCIQLDLKAEWLRVEASWRDDARHYVPLAVAAALAFHRAHGESNAAVDADDYAKALDIAASALSRLIPFFTVRDPRQGPVAIPVDLTRERFTRGAIALRNADLEGALDLVKRAGLNFGLR